MGTKFPELFAALAAPFDPIEVKTRSQSGRQMHYVTARTVQNRLDQVLGPENWWPTYILGENSVQCDLTIRLPDGTLLTKGDAGGYAGMSDQGDDDKSGYSDSLKRAGVVFGVGRYLYRDGMPPYVLALIGAQTAAEEFQASPQTASRGREPGSDDNRPGRAQGRPERAPERSQGQRTRNDENGNVPRTGRALFAWTKDQEQRHDVGLLKYLNSWAKLQEYPARMVDWNAEQVSLAHAEAMRKLSTLDSGRDMAYEDAMSN